MALEFEEKRKPLFSSPSQSPVAIEDLFTSLNRYVQLSEYEQAVKVADRVLSIVPADEDALRCKVVALIKADDIDRALSTIQASEKLTIDLIFFKAYCFYRQNKLEEALESLKSQERNSAAIQLESQILYFLGRMNDYMDIYQKLRKFKIEPAGRAFEFEVQGMMDALRFKASTSFKLTYNTACSLIEKKKYQDAEHHLLLARRIGQEALMEDNWADDEIEIELAPIFVQLAYVQQLFGHTQDAMETYTDIINRNLADDLSLAVAINNLISLRGPKDVSDSLRKLDQLIEKGSGVQTFQLARGLDYQLSAHREALYSNRVLLLLHANRMDQARELVAALPDMFPDSIVPVLLQSAVLVRKRQAGRAEEILARFADKFPEKSKVALLARAQVAAAAGHHQIAAESLARIPDIQHMPATVATLLSLKVHAGDVGGAVAVLDSAIDWWSNSMTEDNKLNVILHEAASFKLKHDRDEEAASLYEKLVKSHGSIEALVGLVMAAARVDVEKAEAYEKQLKPLPGLKRIDVDSLEKTYGAKHIESSGHVSNMEAYAETKRKAKVKRKRKRKPRYPKGFDPVNPGPPPDPERWLPKRERSSYKPRMKDKGAAQIRGSQGAVVKEKQEANSAITNTNSNPKSNQATANSKGSAQSASSEQLKRSSSKSSRKKSSLKTNRQN